MLIPRFPLRRVGLVLIALVAASGPLVATASSDAQTTPSALCGGFGYVVTNSGSLIAFDTQTGLLLGSPVATGSSPADVDVTADGSRVVVPATYSDELQIFDAATLALIGSVPMVTPGRVAVSSVSDIAYVTQGAQNQISIVDLSTLTVTGTIATAGDASFVALSADGSTIWVAEYSTSTIERFTSAGNPVGSAIVLSAHPESIALTPDGATAYVTTLFDNTIVEIDAQTAMVFDHAIQNFPQSAIVTPDGQHLWFSGMGGGQVEQYALPAFTPEQAASAPGNPMSIALTADGATIFVVTAISGTLTGISTADASQFSVAAVTGTPRGVAVCPQVAPAPVPTTTTIAVDPVAPSFTG